MPSKKISQNLKKGTVGRGNALDLTQQFQVTTIRPISKTSAGVAVPKRLSANKNHDNIPKLHITED